jgi:hypothetical protein
MKPTLVALLAGIAIGAAAVAALAVSSAGATAPNQALASALRGCASPAKFRGVHRDNYVRSCQVCGMAGWRQVRREYHIASTKPAVIALRYAQKAYRPTYRQAVFEGCLRGFRLRGRP